MHSCVIHFLYIYTTLKQSACLTQKVTTSLGSRLNYHLERLGRHTQLRKKLPSHVVHEKRLPYARGSQQQIMRIRLIPVRIYYLKQLLVTVTHIHHVALVVNSSPRLLLGQHQKTLVLAQLLLPVSQVLPELNRHLHKRDGNLATRNCREIFSMRLSSFRSSLYRQFLAVDEQETLRNAIQRESRKINLENQLAEHHIKRNLEGNFGPNHYARFFCRQFKIYRGTRGKWGNRGIVNDFKWRFPKAG
jgi:hypothetical protein